MFALETKMNAFTSWDEDQFWESLCYYSGVTPEHILYEYIVIKMDGRIKLGDRDKFDVDIKNIVAYALKKCEEWADEYDQSCRDYEDMDIDKVYNMCAEFFTQYTLDQTAQWTSFHIDDFINNPDVDNKESILAAYIVGIQDGDNIPRVIKLLHRKYPEAGIDWGDVSDWAYGLRSFKLMKYHQDNADMHKVASRML